MLPVHFKLLHDQFMVVQAAMMAKLEASVEQQGVSNLQPVDTPDNSDESGNDSSPGASRPDTVAAGKVPAQKRARQTKASWESAGRLPGSSAASEAARPALVPINSSCVYTREAM